MIRVVSLILSNLFFKKKKKNPKKKYVLIGSLLGFRFPIGAFVVTDIKMDDEVRIYILCKDPSL